MLKLGVRREKKGKWQSDRKTRERERDYVVEGVVVVTVVSCSEEEGFMAADEAGNVLADWL